MHKWEMECPNWICGMFGNLKTILKDPNVIQIQDEF